MPDITVFFVHDYSALFNSYTDRSWSNISWDLDLSAFPSVQPNSYFFNFKLDTIVFTSNCESRIQTELLSLVLA